ncbi:hypothetical protein [Nocardia farcinica]|uniref:Minor tail protein n=1 Tax=Nocardia farcinica (strain IFM 10152) TaxID=247156 RepID=Q5Z3T7_NOCFA|nr:hypothetical protein [Nocardia farcinica]BAD54904.1 hypothetical protein NFA_620 [Nocardia farcinica IFM 10152]
MADLPPLKYGKVVGRFLANTADGPDIDDMPEFRPMSGSVKFTAAPDKILVYGSEPPATVVQLPDHYVASLDEFGYLTWRDERGIRLISPDAEVNPTGWTWTVSFDLSFDGQPIALAPYAIEVPPYVPGPDPEDPDEGSTGLVDLTLVSPVPASRGEAVVRGLSVVDVQLVGDALVFVLDNGDSLDPVTVPSIAESAANAAVAQQAAADADAARDDARAAVDSFDLSIGTVTTAPTGSPASATVSGGPPAWTLDLTLPQGPEGPAGSNDWTEITGKPATFPPTIGPGPTAAVAGDDPRLSDARPPTAHSHPASQIYDASTVGQAVLTASTAAAARTALGVPADTDPRLSDPRTPAVGTVPYDIHIPVCGKNTTRAVGTGDFPWGIKLQRAVTIKSITLRGNTAAASGNLVVELRKNGTPVAGTSTSVAAADQVTGGTPNTGTWAFAKGDVLLPYITAVGTSPGLGLIVELEGLA